MSTFIQEMCDSVITGVTRYLGNAAAAGLLAPRKPDQGMQQHAAHPSAHYDMPYPMSHTPTGVNQAAAGMTHSGMPSNGMGYGHAPQPFPSCNMPSHHLPNGMEPGHAPDPYSSYHMNGLHRHTTSLPSQQSHTRQQGPGLHAHDVMGRASPQGHPTANETPWMRPPGHCLSQHPVDCSAGQPTHHTAEYMARHLDNTSPQAGMPAYGHAQAHQQQMPQPQMHSLPFQQMAITFRWEAMPGQAMRWAARISRPWEVT